MAITFPRSLAQFADILGVQSVDWKLQDNREYSGLGSGQIIEVDLGPALWTGDVTLREWPHKQARAIEAQINAIVRSMGTFYLTDPRRTTSYPAKDPTGSILGAATVRINTLPDAKSMTLSGLPAGYKLTAGDYLSFDYGTDPVRRAFHELSEDVIADASGVTPAFDVSPFIRPGAATSAIVTLKRAAMLCRIVPKSLDVSQSSYQTTTQISFSVVQKI